MKVEILLNGSYKIVLVPENEVEKGILNAISKTEVDVKSIEQHTQILDKVIQEGLVITTKKGENKGTH
jgi:hypothetical protein